MNKELFEMIVSDRAEKRYLEAVKALAAHIDNFFKHNQEFCIHGGWSTQKDKMIEVVSVRKKEIIKKYEENEIGEIFMKIDNLKFLFEGHKEND